MTHFFQCIYLFPFYTCFEQPSAHHQENRNVSIHQLVYVTLCRWLPGIPPGSHLHRVTYTRWCIDTIRFSWWWELGCSKHVEKGNKYVEKSASSWLLTRIVANDLGAFLSFWLLDAEDKDAVVLRNVDNSLLTYTAYRPWMLESAVTPLWEPQILQLRNRLLSDFWVV